MRWLLDTNVWIDAHAGRSDARQVFSKMRLVDGVWIGFSAITRLELLSYSPLTAADDSTLRALLAQFEEVPVSSEVIEEAIHELSRPNHT
jgi:predicted nucleic acid-binding protein